MLDPNQYLTLWTFAGGEWVIERSFPAHHWAHAYGRFEGERWNDSETGRLQTLELAGLTPDKPAASKRYRVELHVETAEILRHFVEVEANSAEEAEAEALALDDYGPGSWLFSDVIESEVFDVREIGGGEQ